MVVETRRRVGAEISTAQGLVETRSMGAAPDHPQRELGPVERVRTQVPGVDMAAAQLPLPQLVSVVIPCYNQARFLGQAIESVKAQTHPFVEIVVVDDGSTDDTVAVASRYRSVRCVTQHNQGQGAARNKGLTYVSGGYVVFLDSDDRLLPPALETGLR